MKKIIITLFVLLALSGCDQSLFDDDVSDDSDAGYMYCVEDRCWYCEDGVCYPTDGSLCEVNDDCAPGCYCADDGSCIEAGWCTYDGDCADELVCDNRASCVPGAE